MATTTTEAALTTTTLNQQTSTTDSDSTTLTNEATTVTGLQTPTGISPRLRKKGPLYRGRKRNHVTITFL